MPKARWAKPGKELQIDDELTGKTRSVPDTCGGSEAAAAAASRQDAARSSNPTVIASVAPLLPSVGASARSAPLRSPKSPVQKSAHGKSSAKNKPGKQRKRRSNSAAPAA